MSEEETRNTEVEEEAPEADELAEELLEAVEEETAEEVEDPTTFGVRVFFHTGAAMSVHLPFQSTVDDLRKKLEREYDRRTYGSTVLVDGKALDPDDETYAQLVPGNIVTFSGTVKGG
ncbi:MAG: hypothetical protein GWN93_05890 [Deltaproteobacteria bacterium]|nr:hypothetical protein [Deltaproteobacteria bacterium]